jgi:hypothetical protein
MATVLSELLEFELEKFKQRYILQLMLSNLLTWKPSSKLAKRMLSQAREGYAKGLVNDIQFVRLARHFPLADEANRALLAEVDAVGRKSGLVITGAYPTIPARIALDLYTANQSLRGLLPFAMPVRLGKSRAQYSALESVSIEMLTRRRDDSIAIQTIITAFRAAKGLDDHGNVSELADQIISNVADNRVYQFFDFVADSPHYPRSKAIELVDLACERLKKNHSVNLFRFQEFLKAKLDSRQSRLDDPAICERLSLPNALILR